MTTGMTFKAKEAQLTAHLASVGRLAINLTNVQQEDTIGFSHDSRSFTFCILRFLVIVLKLFIYASIFRLNICSMYFKFMALSQP